MTNLLKKINLEKLGIFSFLLFFLFTPLLPKIQIAAGVYVEPLAPFLGLGLVLILFSFWRSGKRGKLWEKAKNLLLPNRLSFLYFLLIAFLLGSFVYGYFLTGIFSGDDLLHLVKYTLYFLPFPLAIYVGRILGFKNSSYPSFDRDRRFNHGGGFLCTGLRIYSVPRSRRFLGL